MNMKYIRLFVCLILISNAHLRAQDEASVLWKDITEARLNGEIDRQKELCEKLVSISDPYDSLAVISREILADIHMSHGNMHSIYESYAYFHRYNKDNPGNRDYETYEYMLKGAYDRMLEEDKALFLPEGIYFSDFHDAKYQPLLLLQIKKVGGRYYAGILDGCQLMTDAKNKKFGGLRHEEEIIQSLTSDSLQVYWSGSRNREPMTELSHRLIDENRRAKAEAYGNISANSPTFKDAMLATLIVESVGGLIDMIANAMARGKVVSRSNNLQFVVTSEGTLSAEILIKVRTMMTDYPDPVEKSMTVKFNMHKIYPHDEIFFLDKAYNKIITADNAGIELTGDAFKRFVSFHPSQFNPYIMASYKVESPCSIKRVTKLMEPNGVMYKHYALKNYFSTLNEDPMARYLPDFTDMQETYNDDGRIAIGRWSRRYKGYDEFKAVYYSNSDEICYSQVVAENPAAPVARSCYFSDGSFSHGQFIGDVMNGMGYLVSAEGEVMEGQFYDGYFYSGICSRHFDDRVFRIMKTDGNWSSFPQIEYKNGDCYVGQYRNYLPNGQGIMMKANGEVVKGEWKDGVKVVPSSTVQKTTKKTYR